VNHANAYQALASRIVQDLNIRTWLGGLALDNWLAVAIIANKALLQQKEGKKFRMAILTGTRVSEVQVGTVFKLGNAEYRASTKGWVEE